MVQAGPLAMGLKRVEPIRPVPEEPASEEVKI